MGEVRAGCNSTMGLCVVDKCGWLGCADCCHNNGVLAPDYNGSESHVMSLTYGKGFEGRRDQGWDYYLLGRLNLSITPFYLILY